MKNGPKSGDAAQPSPGKKTEDESLDEALEETFPASDPVSGTTSTPAGPPSEEELDRARRENGGKRD